MNYRKRNKHTTNKMIQILIKIRRNVLLNIDKYKIVMIHKGCNSHLQDYNGINLNMENKCH